MRECPGAHDCDICLLVVGGAPRGGFVCCPLASERRKDHWMRAVPRDLASLHSSLCSAEGLRSDLPARVCSCRAQGLTDGWAVRQGESNLAALRFGKLGPHKICQSVSQSDQTCRAASTRSAEHLSRCTFFGSFQKNGDRGWLANQPVSRPNPPLRPTAYKDGSVQAALLDLGFACLGPRRSSNLDPIIGALIDVRRAS